MPARSTTTRPSLRMTADERRAAIIRAAVSEFSEKGLDGTSTEAIARRAGISQPYVFQLFGSKRDLFIATLRQAFERTRLAFEATGEQARLADPSTASVLQAMGETYCDLLRDRELLACQLHAYAACADAEIRAAVRAEFAALYRSVAALSGADAVTLDHWFAWGMLMNTVVALAPELADDGENLTLSALGRPQRDMVATEQSRTAPKAAGRRTKARIPPPSS